MENITSLQYANAFMMAGDTKTATIIANATIRDCRQQIALLAHLRWKRKAPGILSNGISRRQAADHATAAWKGMLKENELRRPLESGKSREDRSVASW